MFAPLTTPRPNSEAVHNGKCHTEDTDVETTTENDDDSTDRGELTLLSQILQQQSPDHQKVFRTG